MKQKTMLLAILTMLVMLALNQSAWAGTPAVDAQGKDASNIIAVLIALLYDAGHALRAVLYDTMVSPY